MKRCRHAPRVFFLGGQDLEMMTIRQLLDETGAEVVDHGLGWGAEASAYRAEIADALARGRQPVLVELGDLDALGELGQQVVVIDHHGARAGADQPTSLQQVFQLLDLPAGRWTRWHALVAANDRGHVRAMAEMGATHDEIVRVRRADRAAQGVTAEQEEAGARAVREARVLAGGELTVADLPHNRTAVVADRLEPGLGGPGYRNLLVLCPDEVDFFGEGKWVQWLNRRFPGGWSGGDLPDRGYWGHTGALPEVMVDLLDAMGRIQDDDEDTG